MLSPESAERERLLSDATGDYRSFPTDNDHVETRENAAHHVEENGFRSELIAVVPALFTGIFLSALDTAVITSSVATIGSELLHLSDVSWIVTSYLLTLTACMPLYGKISDCFGRKPCLLVAYMLFGVGCFWCGVSRNFWELVAARAFTGVGGSGMATLPTVILSDLVPLRTRGTWQGIVNLIFSIGAATGAPIGGLVADTLGWRWIFLIQCPFALVAIISTTLLPQIKVVNAAETDNTSLLANLKGIDFVGAILLVLSIISLLLGLDFAPKKSWSDNTVIISLVLFLLLILAFLAFEKDSAVNPITPLRILGKGSLFAANLCYFFAYASWFSLVFYISLFYQATHGVSASGAGVRVLPSIAGNVAGGILGGIMIQRTGRYYFLTFCAFLLGAIGLIPILLWTGGPLGDSTGGTMAGLFISALGTGTGLVGTLVSVTAVAGVVDQAVATSCAYVFRGIGMMVGIALCQTIVQHILRVALERSLSGLEDIEGIVKKVATSLIYLEELDENTRRTVVECYTSALQGTFMFCLVASVCALVSSLFLREKPLNKR